MKGFVIAGTGSGSGKTTICLGILAYLSKLGYHVAPFKVGPDFIDPGHHRSLTGKVSRNLDSWMLSREVNEKIFAKGCMGADVAVVEGVMGLFDGYSGTSEAGSTAQMAKWLRLPVILVVDARSMARSAAAIVQGFENFDPDLEFAGVIFSKTGSQRHYAYLKEAVEDSCRMKCLGHMPRDPEIAMSERHLGLVTSDEQSLSCDKVEKLVEMLDRNTSLCETVENMQHHLETPSHPENIKTDGVIIEKGWKIPERSGRIIPEEGQSKGERSDNIRIAVARDKAFCFYYQENIEALQEHGAKTIEFSPITSTTLPPNIHGIYFGGGYPELFASELSSNSSLMGQIKQKSLQGMPIYGECGGFMYLCKEIKLVDKGNDKSRYPMVGCFPFSAVMSEKMRSLGYRQITLKQDTIIGKQGDVLRGHEFHYSALEDESMYNKGGANQAEQEACGGADQDRLLHKCELHQGGSKRVYDTAGRDGQEISLNGYQSYNTLGSYLHLHFESMAGAAPAFVAACRSYKIHGGLPPQSKK